MNASSALFFFFFFNDTATTEIYTLSLHDALPISSTRAARASSSSGCHRASADAPAVPRGDLPEGDRKSTRLNSSHLVISYAVFCLKKKKTKTDEYRATRPNNCFLVRELLSRTRGS